MSESLTSRIMSDPDRIWNRMSLSHTPGITTRIIRYIDSRPEYASNHWNWFQLSKNVPIEDIRQTATSPMKWDKWWLSRNPGITMEDVKYLPLEGMWDWETLSMEISFEDIVSNPMLPWGREQIYMNITAPPEEVMHLDLPNEQDYYIPHRFDNRYYHWDFD